MESAYTVTQPQHMYNLTIATAHTYFVGEEQAIESNVSFEQIDSIIDTATQSFNQPNGATAHAKKTGR